MKIPKGSSSLPIFFMVFGVFLNTLIKNIYLEAYSADITTLDIAFEDLL